MTEHLADRTGRGPDHRHPDDQPLPGTEDLTPLSDDPWADACRCGWAAGHRDVCVCASFAEEADDCGCEECRQVDLDALADLLEPPWVTLTPNARYL